ncbi:MAG: hypothetical protein GEV09_14640 [Pseudonocardiaceae bacterium]|nr:hypothetical protein [Pseudonocardiaceae bacterium]
MQRAHIPGPSLTPESVLASQQLAGNRATAAAIAVQRQGNGDGASDMTKKGVRKAADVADKGADAATIGHLPPAFGSTGPSTAFGDAETGLYTVGSLFQFGGDLWDLGDGIRTSLAPRSSAEHEEAMQRVGDSLVKLHGSTWKGVSKSANALSNVAPTAGSVASVAGVVAAYFGFATQLVKTGQSYMDLGEIQKAQLDWADPKKALTEAGKETGMAGRAITATTQLRKRAAEAATKEQEGLEEQKSRLAATNKKWEELKETTIGSRREDVDTAMEGDQQRYQKAVDQSRQRLHGLKRDASSQNLAVVRAGMFEKHALEKRIARKNFSAALEAQKKSGVKALEDRFIPLDEIKKFAEGKIQSDTWEQTALSAAAAVAFGGAVAGLALGWTPVGWALFGAAGLVGLGIGAFKLGKWVLTKTGKRRSDEQIYAERLWQFARHGSTDKMPRAVDEEWKAGWQHDARSVLAGLGLSWSAGDVATMSDTAAIGSITTKLTR